MAQARGSPSGWGYFPFERARNIATAMYNRAISLFPSVCHEMVNICLRRKGQPLDIGQGAGVALGKTLPISLTMADYISKRDKLLEKRRKLDAELKALEARAKQQERKDETRRKIIFGALVMNAATDDPRVMAWMRSLTAADMPAKDRALVDAWFESTRPQRARLLMATRFLSAAPCRTPTDE